MGRYLEKPRFAFFKRNENIYVLCNLQGQKLDSRHEIYKHIVVFTYQLYRFMLDVYNDVNKSINQYNDVYQFSNNRAFVVK